MISLSVILVLQLSIFSLASCASPSATVGFKPTGSEPPKARRIGDNDNRINNEHRTEPGRAEVSVDAVKISGVETLGSLSIPLGYSLQGGAQTEGKLAKAAKKVGGAGFSRCSWRGRLHQYPWQHARPGLDDRAVDCFSPIAKRCFFSLKLSLCHVLWATGGWATVQLLSLLRSP